MSNGSATPMKGPVDLSSCERAERSGRFVARCLVLAAFCFAGASNTATADDLGEVAIDYFGLGECDGALAKLCRACDATFTAAVSKRTSGKSSIVYYGASLAFENDSFTRIVYPSMKMVHSEGIAYGLSECELDTTKNVVSSAKIWFRSDDYATNVPPIMGPPERLRAIFPMNQPRPTLLVVAETSDLAAIGTN